MVAFDCCCYRNFVVLGLADGTNGATLATLGGIVVGTNVLGYYAAAGTNVGVG